MGSPWPCLYQRTVATLSSGSSGAMSQGSDARPPRTTHTVDVEDVCTPAAKKKVKNDDSTRRMWQISKAFAFLALVAKKYGTILRKKKLSH